MRTKTFLLLYILILTCTPAWAEDAPLQGRMEESGEIQSYTKEWQEKQEAQEDRTTMLLSIQELKKKIQQQIERKQTSFAENASTEEKKSFNEEIQKLQESFNQAEDDFEKIATGVDTSKFKTHEETSFNWKQELFSLMQPGIIELKRLTVTARKKTELLNQQANYQELLPVAQQANKNLRALVRNTDDEELKKQIASLIPEWESITSQLKNGLDIAEMELSKMEGEKTSIMDSGKKSLKKFFRTRGFYLGIAFASCLGIVLLLRLVHRLLRSAVPGSRKEYRPFLVRIIDLGFHVFAVILGIFSFILVFYFFEDWVLLSFAIIFLAGLGWTTKTTLPRFWQQSQMMLNLGNVREGERVVLYGVPWLIKNINVRTTIENPALGIAIKIPISELFNKTSRTFDHKEPWFPCRKDDWVILSDGTRGGVVSLSHEQVELVLRGGAHKIYQTQKFLSLAPLNLSRNFRLKEIFGIGYTHQAEATSSILAKVEEFIMQQIEKEGYAKHLLNLRVEFNSAGASSLDFVVIADFDGSQAPIYNRLRRAIQRWCVDVCTENHWDIPFPQLTVHKAE